MEGVDSFLKKSHSGVTPAEMAKESTPGDSDSWNRCNPNSLWRPSWGAKDRVLTNLLKLSKYSVECGIHVAWQSISGLISARACSISTMGRPRPHSVVFKYCPCLRITHFDVEVMEISDCVDYGDVFRFAQRPSIPSAIPNPKATAQREVPQSSVRFILLVKLISPGHFQRLWNLF